MTDTERGQRGVNWEQNDQEWEEIHPEVRAFVLYDFLTAIDLQAVDPEFFRANDYGIQTAVTQSAKDNLLAQRDKMVARYRSQGRMLPVEEIRAKVSRLLRQTPSEMAPQFMEFIEQRAAVNR